MTDVTLSLLYQKWLMLYCNCYITILATISLCKKKKTQAHLRMLSTTKCVYKLYISSSSSCRSSSTDISDPISSLFPIVHRFWQVFRVTFHILTYQLYVCSSWSSCFCLAICGGPKEYITDEFVLASPAVSCVSGSSNLYSFRDGRQVAV